jgi:heme oxygenase
VPASHSLVTRVAAETHLDHRDADRELERLLVDPTVYAYRTWLSHQLAFQAPVEAALDTTPGLSGIIATRPRSKVARLQDDLRALGVELELIEKLTPCPLVPPAFASVPIALGWLYVAERSTLQFHNAYRQLARALPGQLAFASGYLKCYEGTAGVMWRAYAAAVDAICKTPSTTNALISSTRDAFRALRAVSATARASDADVIPASPAMRG